MSDGRLYLVEVEIRLTDPEEMVELPHATVYARFTANDPREMLSIRALDAAAEVARSVERFATRDQRPR